jgi:hypothetical protein
MAAHYLIDPPTLIWTSTKHVSVVPDSHTQKHLSCGHWLATRADGSTTRRPTRSSRSMPDRSVFHYPQYPLRGICATSTESSRLSRARNCRRPAPLTCGRRGLNGRLVERVSSDRSEIGRVMQHHHVVIVVGGPVGMATEPDPQN